MRVAVAFFLAGMSWSAGAQASSIITLAALNEKLSPSMIEVGQPASEPATAALDPDFTTPPTVAVAEKPVGPDDEVQLSPSVVAIGEPEVSQEKVAAVGSDNRKARRASTLMVIRGGIPGDAFSPAAPNEVTLTTGLDQQSTAKPPEASGPVEPAEAAKPGAAAEAPAPAHPAEVIPPVE